MTDRSKMIFGNKMNSRVQRKARQSKQKYAKNMAMTAIQITV